MGSAASADRKKQQRKEQKIIEKEDKALMRKQLKWEKILENHENYDEDGTAFFYDDFGQKYYLDEDLIPFYLDENKQRFYCDKNGHKFYLDKRSRPYYVDDRGEVCHWDDKGNPYYMGEDGQIFYRDYDYLVYYLDDDNMPFYISDEKNKIWILLNCLDENGRVISRTKSRKAKKISKDIPKGVQDGWDKPSTLVDESVSFSSSTLHRASASASVLSNVEEEDEEETQRYQSRELATGTSTTQKSFLTDTSANVTETSITSPQKTASSTSSQASNKTVDGSEFALPRVRTLTPEYHKYLDIPDEKDTGLEDIAKTQLESDRKILGKILTAEKEKGILPPRKLFRKIGYYTVKEKTDKKDCSITGSAFLPNGNLVVSDFRNRNLKMYDPDLKFVTSLNLESYPENMCARAQDFDLFVCFKAGLKYGIKVVKVTDDTMTLVRTLPTKGQCYGICSNNGGLAVIVNTVLGWQVHLLDLKGVAKKQLTMEIDDKPLLMRPDYLAVTRDLRLLISDRGANNVLCFDIWSEKVFFEYKGIREPYGVSCDNKGSIFVTSPGGVHQISTAGDRIAMLMKREDIGFSPTCACYDIDDSLLVLTGQSNRMVAFQLVDALTQGFDQKMSKPRR